MRGGHRDHHESLAELRARATAQLRSLPETLRRPEAPPATTYPVIPSRRLATLAAATQGIDDAAALNALPEPVAQRGAT
jgi:hypothetical protein